VAVALLLASVLLVTYYVALKPEQEGYTTIYLLDENGSVNYPEVLAANLNSTFSVRVNVENHLGNTTENATVKIKIANYSNPTFPLDVNATQVFTKKLNDGERWENLATISLNQPGDYLVAFELWILNKTGDFQYSKLAALNIHVV
jgi:uncharacterized membrane protein